MRIRRCSKCGGIVLYNGSLCTCCQEKKGNIFTFKEDIKDSMRNLDSYRKLTSEQRLFLDREIEKITGRLV